VGGPEGPRHPCGGRHQARSGALHWEVKARPGAGEMHQQVWKMGATSALSKGQPSRPFRWVTRRRSLVKGTPLSGHPPRTPGGRPGGGTIGTPTSGRLRDRKPISTSWLLTKMRIRHLSYISTDLFWTKISTANTKVAFLPLGAHNLVWDLSIYIQTHQWFFHTKHPRKCHPKIFHAKF